MWLTWFVENPGSVLVIVVIIFLLVSFLYWLNIVLPRKIAQEQEAKWLAVKAFRAETARIEALPKLDTRWLMRIPGMHKGLICRSYGTRYNRMVVVDELGDVWVGLIIPEIIEGLKVGEYIWSNYFIPFCSMEGEAYHGNPVTFDGLRIDTYPLWMKEGVNPVEWGLWAMIERKFDDCSRYWNYQSGLGELNKLMKEFNDKRAKFNKLAEAVKE
jgi:hypothetical protein